MISLSLQQMLLNAAALLLIGGVQGWAVAAAAVALGDPGPKYDGRLTPSPFNHLDLLGAACLILFSLGWTRPVAIDPRELRSRWSPLLIAGSGLLAVLALALLMRLAMPLLVRLLPGSASIGASVFLSTAVNLALRFGLFNLLPIPPLTAGLAWLTVMPGLRERGRKYLPYAQLGLALLIFTGLAGSFLGPTMRWFSGLVQAL